MRGWASGRGATGARQHGRTHVARLYAQVREPVSAACEGSARKESGPIARRAARTLIERAAQVEPARHVAPTTLSRPPMPSVGRQDRRTQGGWTRKGSASRWPSGGAASRRSESATRSEPAHSMGATDPASPPRSRRRTATLRKGVRQKRLHGQEQLLWRHGRPAAEPRPFRADRMYQRQVPARSGRARSTVGPARQRCTRPCR